MSANHPTQIFLSNPQGLRLEFRLDDSALILWWSPLAGVSTDCRDRNYSSRDAHRTVFESIALPGCGLESFAGCDYDAYHSVLRFDEQTLHPAMSPDEPLVLVWATQPLDVEIKAPRFSRLLSASDQQFAVMEREPRFGFEMVAALGPGVGRLRHTPWPVEEQSLWCLANLKPGQALALGIGLEGAYVAASAENLARQGPESLLERIEQTLAPHIACGQTVSEKYPELDALRTRTLRTLHAMIDESGAFRASLKAIYYLLWVRDSGFSFACQAAAGWPHKLRELCRLLLDNPLQVRDPGLPNTRMFGQLIHRDLGKLEEDGLYYVVWSLFTLWTQTGRLDFLSTADWELLDEALAWVEAVTWDPERGLFGEFTADETATFGSRDAGWDRAIGKPIEDYHLRWRGQAVIRNYDVYFNTCMHSTYCMLAAMRNDPAPLEKAERLWPELHTLLKTRHHGVPVYGELLMADGSRELAPHWGPDAGASCCVWGLTMPNFLPWADKDDVLAATLDAILAKPDMHFINGICMALAAVDPWVYDEEKLLGMHQRIAAEAERPGRYLPMGGAMPEKFNAPEGNLYHDIRPQGFAMGAWLGAWSALGLRRLPHGLALRPTTAYQCLKNYAWRESVLDVEFGPRSRQLALEIDGRRVEGTLQIPEKRLSPRSHIRLVESAKTDPLWLRSTVRLDDVTDHANTRTYTFMAHGLSQISFSTAVEARVEGLPHVEWTCCQGIHTAHFTHFGAASLTLDGLG